MIKRVKNQISKAIVQWILYQQDLSNSRPISTDPSPVKSSYTQSDRCYESRDGKMGSEIDMLLAVFRAHNRVVVCDMMAESIHIND